MMIAECISLSHIHSRGVVTLIKDRLAPGGSAGLTAPAAGSKQALNDAKIAIIAVSLPSSPKHYGRGCMAECSDSRAGDTRCRVPGRRDDCIVMRWPRNGRIDDQLHVYACCLPWDVIVAQAWRRKEQR